MGGERLIMKKCVLVNCFASSNEMRVEPIREVLDAKGYDTIYISSDYHHALKKYVELDPSIVPIHVHAYKKNLSIDRLLSHREFSKKVYEYLCKVQPELIYIKFPPNMLVKAAYEYKKNHKCKVILDMFDLWPESLPVSKMTKKIAYPFLSVWAGYRDKYISCADLVLTECNMYREVLSDILPQNTYTLYLTKKDVIDYQFNPSIPGKIRLCFLGGINYLTDIEAIGKLIHDFREQGELSLDIIGDGQRREDLIKVAQENGCETRFHGIIYDEGKKYRIMSNCDLGLNLVKDSVRIALSIKSVEYFRAGLGVVNNVPFDTWKIIEESKSGINISKSLVAEIPRVDDIKKKARRVYDEYFSIPITKRKFEEYYYLITYRRKNQD